MFSVYVVTVSVKAERSEAAKHENVALSTLFLMVNGYISNKKITKY